VKGDSRTIAAAAVTMVNELRFAAHVLKYPAVVLDERISI
jgi:hypothetical protein